MEQNISKELKFQDLCELFESLRASNKPVKRKEILSAFIKNYKEKGEAILRNYPNADISFYHVLRLLVPQLERDRNAYGIRESTFVKVIINILCLPHESPDALRLSKFRESTSNSQIKDFADAAYWVLRKRFTKGGTITVYEVNSYLDSVANKNKENDRRTLEKVIYNMFQVTSADEQKWLIRIILKDLRLGMGNESTLKVFHPDAMDYFSATNSLEKLCKVLNKSSVRLHEIEITMFSPFRPMLSQRCDVSEFNKVVTPNKIFFIENKFDGERFQLHMENGKYKYFSRNGYDMTVGFGSNFSEGIYTPLLRNVFHSHIQSVILDGEMMGFNTVTKKLGSKGMNFDVKHLKESSVHQPCFCVFDILLLNDKILTNVTLKERLQMLESALTPIEGVIVISEKTQASCKQDILDAINKSADSKEEGIVFKNPDSCYKPNERKSGWWKMKLEYFENVMSDLDLIIMGGYYGEGRNRLRISGFLFGVAVPGRNGLIPKTFLSFAKISSGLSDTELSILEKKLSSFWVKRGEGDPEEHGLIFGKEFPNVWIPPRHSCVLQVRASELIKIKSQDYKTEYTLRFPRIQKIREDKLYYDCLTTEELHQFTEGYKFVKKLDKRHLELSDFEVQLPKKRMNRNKYIAPEILPVIKKSDILKGYEFFVLTGYPHWQKTDVENAIREHGGSVVKVEGNSTFCILIGTNHPRVDTFKKFNVPHDVVHLYWLNRILCTGKFEMYNPKDLLHISLKTHFKFLEKYDKYGDSYVNYATEESLREVCLVVKEKNMCINLTQKEIAEFNKEIKFAIQLNILRNCTAYFDKYEYINIPDLKRNRFSLEEAEFRFFGGIVVDHLTDYVDIVVTDLRDNSRHKELKSYLNSINNEKALIVDRIFISNKVHEMRYSSIT